jgi:hypothetical protein
MMDAGKEPSAGQTSESRVSIPAKNENAFARFTFSRGPFNSHTMGRVLAGKAKYSRNAGGTYLLQADEAKTRDGMAGVKFRAKAGGEEFLHDRGVHSKIDKQTPPDEALEGRDFNG